MAIDYKIKILEKVASLSELLHACDIQETLRSQFTASILIYLKEKVKELNITVEDEASKDLLFNYFNLRSSFEIIKDIEDKIEKIINGADEYEIKRRTLIENIFYDKCVNRISHEKWNEILIYIFSNFYIYIEKDVDLSNLFFNVFQKYINKKDKNQAFTPDHIADFMCKAIDIDDTSVVFDGGTGTGTFLCKALDQKKKPLVYGTEIEETAYGLAVSNMILKNGDINCIKLLNIFNNDALNFIREKKPNRFLLNPPYNSKVIYISDFYKKDWNNKKKQDPTKGMIFVERLIDAALEYCDLNDNNKIKIALLIKKGAGLFEITKKSDLYECRKRILQKAKLDAVFSMPDRLFYPGANIDVSCLIFEVGKPHSGSTFFGLYRDDNHITRRNLGPVEQPNGKKSWKEIEKVWLELYKERQEVVGLTCNKNITIEDEWVADAYVPYNFKILKEENFQLQLNEYIKTLINSKKYPNLSSYKDNTMDLRFDSWRRFDVNELFLVSGSKNTTKKELAKYNEGQYPYITTSTQNNGIEGYYDYFTEYGRVLTIESAAAGYCAYQKENFSAIHHVEKLIPKFPISTKIGLFIATVINADSYRYSYGYKLSKARLVYNSYYLPAKEVDGKYVPDFKFMEDYMSSLVYGKELD